MKASKKTEEQEPGCPKCGESTAADGTAWDGLCDSCGWDEDGQEYSR